MTKQPPTSPDLNVLDLGFFRATQSLQHQQQQMDIDTLIAATERAFDVIENFKLKNVFREIPDQTTHAHELKHNRTNAPNVNTHEHKIESIVSVPVGLGLVEDP